MYHRYLATERLVKKKNIYIKKLTNQIIGIYFISCGITTGPKALNIVNFSTAIFTTFSFLPLLICTYAVMVDSEKKGNLHDVLQNNNDESYFLNKKR